MSRPRPIRAALLALAGLAGAAAPLTPAAAEGRSEGVDVAGTRFAASEKVRIEAGDEPLGDTYAAGRELDISRPIAGDLIASGGILRVGADVAGDAALAVGETRLEGNIADDLRWFGGTLDLYSNVGSDALLAGGRVYQHLDSRVDGLLLIWGGVVTLRGSVGGPVHVTGGEVELSGRFDGDVEVQCDELTLGKDVEIAGDLRYEARNKVQVPEAAVGGKVHYSTQPPDTARTRPNLEDGVGYLSTLFGVGFQSYLAFTALIAGLLMIVFLRPFVDGAIAEAEGGSALIISFGVGLVSMLVMLMLGLLCLLLLPLGLGIWAALGALIYFGGLIGKMIAGVWLLKPLRVRRAHPVLGLLIGVVLLFLLGLIPILGDVIWLFVTVTGMGASLLRIRSAETDRRAGGAPPVPTAP